MKIGKLQLNNSIFSRLVITFLVIIIPIYVLGIYMYYWGLHTVKDEITNSTTAQVSFYLQGLEKEIERIKILQYDCLNDENLNKLAVRWPIMDTYEQIDCMRQLQQKLAMIRNSSIYISDVSVHILPINRTISSNTGVDAIDLEKFHNIRVPAGIRGAQIINYKGGLYLSTLQEPGADASSYMIDIELNKAALQQALSQFNTYEHSGSFLISMLNKDVIINQSDAGNIPSVMNFASKLEDSDSGMDFIKIHNKGYYLVYARSEYLDMVLLRYIPEGIILKPLQNFNAWAWVFTVAALSIIVIFSYSTYKFMHKPLLQLVESFRRVESGDLQVSISHDSKDEFGYLYKRFNEMVKNLKMLINQVYNQKILMQRAELKHLQSQINPHFLYNSFFMINTMATIGDENLIPFTKHLGEYFRFVTRSSSDYIPLEEEIKHAKVYTDIQQMRFSKRLQIQFGECPEKYFKLSVPRLIIQPLIENAFEHGIENKRNSGIVSVSFEELENELDIIVEDNGDTITDTGLAELQKSLESDGEGLETTGIINIHRRIRLVFGEESGLKLSRSELGGLKASLGIRLQGGEGNVQTVDRR
ncbi:MAG TPA: histidine kinase [Clostridia bacterium]|nr:histidine kinase [Clostridia bacterium]